MKRLKKISKIILALTIVFFQFPLISNLNSVISESNPTKVYENTEIYESAEIDTQEIKLIKIFQSPKSFNGFYIYGEELDFATQKIFVDIYFKNGDSKDKVEFEAQHMFFDDNIQTESEAKTSELISFEKEIEYLEFYSYTENLNFDVIITEISDNFSPSSISIKGQNLKKYYANLGIDLQVREEWGAPATSGWAAWPAHEISKIIVHHTATTPNNSNPSQAVKNIYNYHKNLCAYTWGSYDPDRPECDEQHELWEDIGYNFLIDQNGTVYEGRAGGPNVTGAHSPPNYGTIGIGLIGNFQYAFPGDSQKNAFNELIIKLAKHNDFELEWGNTLVGHRDRSNTLCPGEAFYKGLPGLLNEAKQKYSPTTFSNNLNNSTRSITQNNKNFLQTGQRVQMMVPANQIDTGTKQFIEENTHTIENFKLINDFYIFSVDDDYVDNAFRDIKTYHPNLDIQPVYIHQIANWAQDDSNGRSTPENYSQSDYQFLEQINMPEAWHNLGGCENDALCGGNSDITIAIIDTGVAYENFDFDAGTYDDENDDNSDGIPNSIVNVDGLNFEIPTSDIANGEFNEGLDRRYSIAPELKNTTFINPKDVVQDFICDWRNGTGSDCNDAEISKINHANDDDGHGTFVTSIISATPDGPIESINNSKLAGMAHNVQIMPIKAFFPNDSSMCYTASGDHDPDCRDSNKTHHLKGISFSFLLVDAVNHASANGADVINMSLSGGSYDPALQSAINNATNNGSIIVTASGNNGSSTTRYPAGYDNTISVGASNFIGNRSSYSNYGSELDLVAPVSNGIPGQWYDCSPNNSSPSCFDESDKNYHMFSNFSGHRVTDTIDLAAGTSFAAPQVSAAVAIILSQNPNLNFNEVRSLLINTANDLGTTGRDEFTGYGELNMLNIVNALNLPTQLIFPYYDTSKSSRSAWNIVGNNSNETQVVSININDEIFDSIELAPNEQTQLIYPGIQNGPVRIMSNSNEIYASQRVLFEGSFNEFEAINVNNLSNSYINSWNDTSRAGRSSWNLVGNPSDIQTANITVFLGSRSNQIDSFTLAPGQQTEKLYPNLLDGPIIIDSDINIYSTQRTLFNGSFNEYESISSSDFGNYLLLTWNDTSKADRQSYILVGNPNESQTANVQIELAGEIIDSYNLSSGNQVEVLYPNTISGPLKILSDIPIYATQRTLYEGSFNEYKAINLSNLSSEYSFPFYDTRDSQKRAWILVGNDEDNSADVEVLLNGNLIDSFTLGPREQVQKIYVNQFGGPIVVRNPTTNRDLYVTQRNLYNGSFNEFPGID